MSEDDEEKTKGLLDAMAGFSHSRGCDCSICLPGSPQNKITTAEKGSEIFKSHFYEGDANTQIAKLHFKNHADYNDFLNWWVLGKLSTDKRNLIRGRPSGSLVIPKAFIEPTLLELDRLAFDKSDGSPHLWILLNKLKESAGCPAEERVKVSWNNSKK